MIPHGWAPFRVGRHGSTVLAKRSVKEPRYLIRWATRPALGCNTGVLHAGYYTNPLVAKKIAKAYSEQYAGLADYWVEEAEDGDE